MAIETERRFLLANDEWRALVSRSYRTHQGYLSDDPDRIVRVRMTQRSESSDRMVTSSLTIKGPKVNGSGLEVEYQISADDASDMLLLCKSAIDKTRYIVDTTVIHDDTTYHLRWEIDEFHGDNDGLIIAEIEFESDALDIKDTLILPNWIGQEITDDVRYANSNLANYPYSTWNKLFV